MSLRHRVFVCSPKHLCHTSFAFKALILQHLPSISPFKNRLQSWQEEQDLVSQSLELVLQDSP
jgi:hypothetical protein